jgi:hypothetical protein
MEQLECKITIVRWFAKPCNNEASLPIYAPHQLNLAGSLNVILLVNAEHGDPEETQHPRRPPARIFPCLLTVSFVGLAPHVVFTMSLFH